MNRPGLVAALALPALGYALMRRSTGDARAKLETERLELERLQAVEALRGAGDGLSLAAGAAVAPSLAQLAYQRRAQSVLPDSAAFGELELSVRDLELADRAGRTLAKQAGIGMAALGAINRLPNVAFGKAQKLVKPVVSQAPVIGRTSGLRSKALVGGLALAGGYGALQAGRSLYDAGMQPAHVKTLGSAAALPRYVNEWGVPQRAHG